MKRPPLLVEIGGSVYAASARISSFGTPGTCERYSPGPQPPRRGASTAEISSCTSESVYSVSHLRKNGRRYEKSNCPKRAPGSSRLFFTSYCGAEKLKKLFRNVCRVIGA